MLKIEIRGMPEGTHNVALESAQGEIPDFADEYRGAVRFSGTVEKNKKQFVVKGVATTVATLLCDRSGTEYNTNIEIPVSLVFPTGEVPIYLKEGEDSRFVPSDARYLDITADVREDLILALPVRRVAPGFEEIDIRSIFPDVDALRPDLPEPEEHGDDAVDPRWSVLKNINHGK